MQLWMLKRRVHVSWLIAACSVGIVVGTAITPVIKQTVFASLLWLVISAALMSMAVWKRYIVLVPLVILAGMVIGLWRGSILSSQLGMYENLQGKNVTVSGNVVDDPDEGNRGETQLRLGNVRVGKLPIAGKVWVSTTVNAVVKRGDSVVVKGVISDGFGSFPAMIYSATVVSIKRPEPGDVARRVRDWFSDGIRVGVHEPAASLGLGYLLGQKRALPLDLQQALVVTGLTHVVVASGYNLTILVRLSRRLFEKVSKYLATLAASVMIFGFMAITGASPSMSRAGLVSGLSLAAWYYGRKIHPLVLLPFAAAVTTLIDPSYAWNDLGWQLSFTAFAGVMILAPLLQAYFFGLKKPGVVRQILGETVSAHIVTLPVLVLAFGQFSNVAILSNLLVLPFVPLAMLLTFIAGLGGLIVPQFAMVISAPAEWVLDYMVGVIHYFATLDWAQTELQIGPVIVLVAYGVIVAMCVYLWRATKLNLRDANVVE